MLRFLVPRIRLSDLGIMFQVAIAGAIVAGVYGIAHDHVTYSISPEYFTRFKFKQFRYADLGMGDRPFVTNIGFLASWWVGFVFAWFMARRYVPDQPRHEAMSKIALGFWYVLITGLAAGLVGASYGFWSGPDTDYSAWDFFAYQYQIKDIESFVRVAYIHNASYLGGLIGFLLAMVLIKPSPKLDKNGDERSVNHF